MASTRLARGIYVSTRLARGIYVGVSTCHSSAIPLIYNIESTHTSPQIYALYDEYF
jgi:hypothetical protein